MPQKKDPLSDAVFSLNSLLHSSEAAGGFASLKALYLMVIEPTVHSDLLKRHTTEKVNSRNIYSSCEIVQQDGKWIWEIKELDQMWHG